MVSKVAEIPSSAAQLYADMPGFSGIDDLTVGSLSTL